MAERLYPLHAGAPGFSLSSRFLPGKIRFLTDLCLAAFRCLRCPRNAGNAQSARSLCISTDPRHPTRSKIWALVVFVLLKSTEEKDVIFVTTAATCAASRAATLTLPGLSSRLMQESVQGNSETTQITSRFGALSEKSRFKHRNQLDSPGFKRDQAKWRLQPGSQVGRA